MSAPASKSKFDLSASEKEALLVEAMDNCNNYILWYLESLCRDKELARDIAQKLWIYVYQNFEPKHFGHVDFLKRKGKNLWIDEVRKQGRRPSLNFVDELPYDKPAPVSYEPENAEREMSLYISFWERFVGVDLSDIQKRVFWHKHRYDETLDEISTKLGIPRSTAHDYLKLVKTRCVEYIERKEDHAI